jgi:uncharacterized membrane protein YfcA
MEKLPALPHSVKRMLKIQLYIVGTIISLLLSCLIINSFHGSSINYSEAHTFLNNFLQRDFIIYVAVGFIAQMIDGSLGMAYGVTSTSFLISTGVSPAIASASVHVAEVFTTGISGFSHWRFGNVDKALFKKLLIPGALGAGIGAYTLLSIDGNVIKPYIACYLLFMGCVIIFKSFKKKIIYKNIKNPRLLALVGGFVDSSGGGGWGPVVTTTLIGTGNNPKRMIGTVNAVEFIVAFVASGIFTLFIGINSWLVIAGLITGGAIAAPIGALVCKKINVRAAMGMVGILIISISLRTILKSMGAI